MSIVDKIRDTIQAGVTEAVGGGADKTPTPSTPSTTSTAAPSDPSGSPGSPSPTPAGSQPPAAVSTPDTSAAVKADMGEGDDDDFEFKDPSDSEPSQETKPVQGEGAEATPGTATTQPTPTTPPGVVDEDSVDWSKLLPPEVEAAFLRTGRGKGMLQAYKERRELSKSPEEGGLGFIPTVQQIKQYHQNSADLEAMDYDFSSGEPESAARWSGFWFGPTKNPQQAQAQAQMAEHLPQFLMEKNFDLYAKLAVTVTNNLVDELWNGAEADPNPDDKKYKARMARALHEYVHGEGSFKRDIHKITGEAAPEPPNPEVLRLTQELEQRRQAEEQSRKQGRETFLKNSATKFEQARTAALNSYVDQALSKLKERLGSTVFYSSAVDNFRKDVDNIVSKNPAFPQFLTARKKAIQSGSPEAVKAANDLYFQIAKPVILNLRSKYLKDGSALLTQQATVAQATHQKVAASGGLPAGGSPTQAPPAATGKPESLPGESLEDRLKRRAQEQFKALLPS